ncbi:MAG: hypothetical protein ABIA74_00925 [bacterium]
MIKLKFLALILFTFLFSLSLKSNLTICEQCRKLTQEDIKKLLDEEQNYSYVDKKNDLLLTHLKTCPFCNFKHFPPFYISFLCHPAIKYTVITTIFMMIFIKFLPAPTKPPQIEELITHFLNNLDLQNNSFTEIIEDLIKYVTSLHAAYGIYISESETFAYCQKLLTQYFQINYFF